MDNIINILKSFGLTGNEARIYLSLLKTNPATGYEISQMTSVPRSAIYSVLSRLESMNIINGVGEKPRRFIPISHEALVEHYSHKLERDLSELRAGLATLDQKDLSADVWFIKGYDNLILKARELIGKSDKRLYLSLWRTEYLALESEVEEALARGVHVTIFSFNHVPIVGANTVLYDLDEEQLAKEWKRSIILVADNANAILGGAQRDAQNQVIWTDHPSLIGLATNHIILDITLAGVRLGQDVTKIVAPMMDNLKLDLDSLIQQSHPLIVDEKTRIATPAEDE